MSPIHIIIFYAKKGKLQLCVENKEISFDILGVSRGKLMSYNIKSPQSPTTATKAWFSKGWTSHGIFGGSLYFAKFNFGANSRNKWRYQNII